jgi:uncharacterized protein YlxP (DUF503 family)
MVVGLVQVELHAPEAQSLKDKRSVVKSIKDQLRGRFNVAVAEVDPNELWQRATLGIVTLGEDRSRVEGMLAGVVEWIRRYPLVHVIQIEQELI